MATLNIIHIFTCLRAMDGRRLGLLWADDAVEFWRENASSSVVKAAPTRSGDTARIHTFARTYGQEDGAVWNLQQVVRLGNEVLCIGRLVVIRPLLSASRFFWTTSTHASVTRIGYVAGCGGKGIHDGNVVVTARLGRVEWS